MDKVAVCVKHVPDGRMRIDPDSKRMDRSGPGELNAFDLNALEEALRIKDAAGATEVIAVSMGPPQADDSLRTALAMGADRAVLVSDPDAAGSDMLATSRVLAGVLDRERPQLTIFGQQASDGTGAVLWSAVAELLQLPVVSQVTELTVLEGALRVKRQTERGDDVIEMPLPAVVAVTDAINEPRYVSLRGQMAAKRKPLETLTLGELGIDPSSVGVTGSMTTVLNLATPPSRGSSIRIDDEGHAAEEILSFLAQRELL